MIRNGSGGKFASFYCEGCEETIEYSNDVFTAWIEGKDVSAQPRYNGVAQEERDPFFSMKTSQDAPVTETMTAVIKAAA
jgi:hypothetical protein